MEVNNSNSHKPFSVLMTTYNGEVASNLNASLESIMIHQTIIPNQVVIVVDGPIRDELDNVLKKYKQLFPNIVDIIYHPINVGQSKASAIGLQFIKYEIFARMDSDDLSISNRFELELAVLEDDSIDVVGGNIAEFEDNPDIIVSRRVVPEFHNDIIKMFRKRMPLNNMTVMMRKDMLIKSGGYGRNTVNEDYSVYSHMWVCGAKFYNIQKNLCLVRIGNGMVNRRNDPKIYKDWKKDQLYLYKNNKHSWFTMVYSNFKCFCFVYSPIWLKKILYKTILRK